MTTATEAASILVVSRHLPEDIPKKKNDGNDHNNAEPILDAADERNDAMDKFNHPRYRRARILHELQSRNGKNSTIDFVKPSNAAPDFTPYLNVQSPGLIEFFTTAWNQWDALGAEGQDPMASLAVAGDVGATTTTTTDKPLFQTPPLVPGNVPLPRDPYQRASQNVMGQIGYYCTDTVTPIFENLQEELQWDVAVMQRAIDAARDYKTVYALATHPGHHAAMDSFGGYCYLNHAAFCAKQLQSQFGYAKVAVLDVDYHCGNGTASIFYDDASVLVISIHCHPDHDYPFHSGFSEETGVNEGVGATLHLPLLPGTTWKEYQPALEEAMQKVQSFGAEALVVSMGLDTHAGDPCAIRRAGFDMSGEDYVETGNTIGSYCGGGDSQIPVLVIQEGGYRMDKVPSAAADVLQACAKAK